MKLFFRITFKICLILTILIGCETAEEIKDTDSEKLFNQGLAAGEKGQYDRSIAFFNEVLELNPRDAKAYNNRGNAYCYKGQYGKAISDYNKAIKINPRHADTYINRGNAYGDKFQYDKACSDWMRACELGSCEDIELARRKGYCK
jgi:tetratricopeptide (TPR) repeat protein